MKPLGQDIADATAREVETLKRLQNALDVIVNDAQIDLDIRAGKRCMEHGAMKPCAMCKEAK